MGEPEEVWGIHQTQQNKGTQTHCETTQKLRTSWTQHTEEEDTTTKPLAPQMSAQTKVKENNGLQLRSN